MIKRLIFGSLFLLFWQPLRAQTVIVFDAGTNEPVADVHIRTESWQAVTNSRGKADISGAADTATLRFSHINYLRRKIQKQKLKGTLPRVYLNPRVTDLDEIVISANRWEQKKKELPNKITTIGQQEISLQQPQTAADLLGVSGEVYIQKSQMGGGSPMLRGFATSRVLLVVDGVRLNNAIFRSGNLHNVISLNPRNMKNSEVIFGPGSVLYGSDAIGGVMDFHTEELTNKRAADANYHFRLSSANKERTHAINWKLSSKKLGVYFSARTSNFSDLKMGTRGNPSYKRTWQVKTINGRDSMVSNPGPNVQRYSGYSQENYLGKLKYQFSEHLSMEYAVHYSATSDIPRYDRLIVKSGDQPKYATWYYGPQKWQMHRLTTQYEGETRFFDQAKLITAYQNYQESRHDRKFRERYLRRRYEEVDIASVNLNMDKSLANQSFYYGLEAVYNKVHSIARLLDIEKELSHPYASRYPDGSSYAYLSAYLAYKNHLSNRFTLNAGMRINQHLVRADFSSSYYQFPFNKAKLNHQAVNGNLGLVYNTPEGLKLTANLSSGFKAPNIDDVGKVFDSEPGTVIVPNRNLQSEYAYNGELQLAKAWGKRHQVDVAAFYTILDNAMVRRDFTFGGRDSIYYDGQLSQVKALVNADQARVYGIQASFKVSPLPNWMLAGHVNKTYGATLDGTPMRHVAPLFGDVHLQFRRKKLTVDAYAEFNGRRAHEDMPPSELGKPHMYATNTDGGLYAPAWHTLNLKAQWNIMRFLSVTAGVENITDRRYRPYASGIAASGRNYFLALHANFST